MLAHEPGLRAYLNKSFAGHVDVSDVIQETYTLLLALSPAQRAAVRTPRAFLFTMARNVALKSLRRRPLVSIDALPDFDVSSIVGEGDNAPPLDETVNTTQELDLLARVIASLPERCREVLKLRKIDELPQKEIARRLGIAEHTVEKHISYALRLCSVRMLETTGVAQGVAAADPHNEKGRTRGTG